MPTAIRLAVLFLSLTVAVSSCRKLGLCHDAELEVAKQPYTGRSLRLDGFYYGGHPVTSTNSPPAYEIIIPYRNGVIMVPGSAPLAGLEQYVEDLRRYPGILPDTKYSWGLFDISGTAIRLADWVPRPCSYYSVLRTGQLLNDSTFVINRIETNRDGNRTLENVSLRYELRHVAARPDSTNFYL